MKLRWSHKEFKCKCGKQVGVGELIYLCKCCNTQMCKECGDEIK